MLGGRRNGQASAPASSSASRPAAPPAGEDWPSDDNDEPVAQPPPFKSKSKATPRSQAKTRSKRTIASDDDDDPMVRFSDGRLQWPHRWMLTVQFVIGHHRNRSGNGVLKLQ